MISIQAASDIHGTLSIVNDNIIDDLNKEVMDDKEVNNEEMTDKKEEDFHLFTPYSASYTQSNPNTLTTNTAFLYDSESDDASLSPLTRIGAYSVDTDLEPSNDSEDSIPLIDRITPPPPLFVLNCDDYTQYTLYHADDEEEEDQLQLITQTNHLFTNLSISIPSPNVSESTTYKQNSMLSIRELCNTITPIPSDYDDDEDDNDNDHVDNGDAENDSFRVVNFGQTNSDKNENEQIRNRRLKKRSSGKRFDWNMPDQTVLFDIDDYVQAHIEDLFASNLSD